jgi:hypothetical protein
MATSPTNPGVSAVPNQISALGTFRGIFRSLALQSLQRPLYEREQHLIFRTLEKPGSLRTHMFSNSVNELSNGNVLKRGGPCTWVTIIISGPDVAEMLSWRWEFPVQSHQGFIRIWNSLNCNRGEIPIKKE